MLEMLLSAAQKAGRPTAALPRFPLGCVIERDDSASLGVYVNVPRMTNDGWGAMRATMFLSAFHKVFGLPNADGSHKHVHCEGLFLMYGPSGEESISRMVGSRQERANGFADAADGSVDYMQLMT